MRLNFVIIAHSNYTKFHGKRRQKDKKRQDLERFVWEFEEEKGPKGEVETHGLQEGSTSCCVERGSCSKAKKNDKEKSGRLKK